MDYQIIWLPKAEQRYQEIIDYLTHNWNDKVIENFINHTQVILSQVKRNPTFYRKSVAMDIYQVLITKHNLLLYRIKDNKIELLTFFDTRQDPNKKHKF